jgi:hypothetical protein
MPSSFRSTGDIFLYYDTTVFAGLAKAVRLTLLGSPLSPAVVWGLVGCLTPAARVFGTALAGQRFGRFAIAAV